MGKVNNNSRSEPLIDVSLYFISYIFTGRPAEWVTDKYSLSPRRERVRVRGMNGRLEDFPVIANDQRNEAISCG